MISLFKPHMGNEELESLRDIFKSGWIGMGSKTEQFEEKFSEYVGCKYTVGLNSATAALDLSLKLLNINHGDEVIVPTITFVSTAHVVKYNLATPIFADVDQDLLIDLKDLKQKITSRTKAIVPVHYAGRPVDMDVLKSIAGDIPIVEDAAHAAGSVYKGNKCGSLGLMGCFSFHAVKNLAMGDGGAITTNNKELYDRAKRLRWLGIDKSTWIRSDDNKSYWWEYSVDEIGLKCVYGQAGIRINGTQSRSIISIVNNKEKCLVDTLDKNGTIIQKKVIGRYKNDIKNRRWIYLTHEFASHRKGYRQKKAEYGDLRGVFLTEDHPVLTINGYIPVSELKSTDLLITANPDFTQDQKSLLIGTLLGDGSIVRHKNKPHENCWFATTHSYKQSEWINSKQEILRNFKGSLHNTEHILKATSKKYKTIHFQSASSVVFSKLRKRFYPDGIKIVPKDLCAEELDSRALATWYMDDGTLNGNAVVLCTDNFSSKDVDYLISLLNSKGYQANRFLHEKKYRIYINEKSSQRFFKDIIDYIVPQLQYKIPVAHRKICWDSCVWKLDPDAVTPRLSSKPIIYFCDPPTRARHKVYCIDVKDTHNFIVGGDIIVHNCHMNDISASIGLVQLSKLDYMNARRRQIAEIYTKGLEGLSEVTTPMMDTDGSESSWHIYCVKCKKRNNLSVYLKEKGIVTGVHYKPIHLYKCYGNIPKLSNAEKYFEEILSLPIHPGLTNDDVDMVIEAICSFYTAKER